MSGVFYARRCKYKHGNELHSTVHAATNKGLLCGRGDIDDGRWYIDYESPEHGVTCPDCSREIKKQTTRKQ